MVRSTRGVGVHPLAQESQVLQLVAVEVAGNVDAFTSHHHHFVSQQNLFGHDGSEPAKKMAPAIKQQNLIEPVRSSLRISLEKGFLTTFGQ